MHLDNLWLCGLGFKEQRFKETWANNGWKVSGESHFWGKPFFLWLVFSENWEYICSTVFWVTINTFNRTNRFFLLLHLQINTRFLTLLFLFYHFLAWGTLIYLFSLHFILTIFFLLYFYFLHMNKMQFLCGTFLKQIHSFLIFYLLHLYYTIGKVFMCCCFFFMVQVQFFYGFRVCVSVCVRV